MKIKETHNSITVTTSNGEEIKIKLSSTVSYRSNDEGEKTVYFHVEVDVVDKDGKIKSHTLTDYV